MKNDKDRWLFFQHDSNPIITSADMRYHRNLLTKNLKVGLEFEFNLPEQEGSCKGDSNACACANMNQENDCWRKCIREDSCFGKPSYDSCANQTGTCAEEDCKGCEHYKASFDCPGIYCPNFISACLCCENFNIDCKTCADRYDAERNPEEIRRKITNEMCPSGSYGAISKTGVHSITTDGSLKGKKGIEIITVGRRVDYWEFYKMSKNIIDATVSKGGYTNERTSIHMHLLAAYYGKMFPNERESGVPNQINELEKPLPKIILANFHQLCRRYQNAMTWMTTGLDDPDRLTRWEKFRVSVLDISAILNSMAQVKDMVSSNAGGGKYGWVNYNYTTFDKNGDVNRLHLEMRSAECLLSPSAVAALACMYHALMIKAVEISRWGVVEVGDDAWAKQARKVKQALMNNCPRDFSGDRFSNTSSLHKYYDVLIDESLDLIRQLKHILIKIGPAYEVLEKLAVKPCSIRLCEGNTWDQIEKDLAVVLDESDRLEMVFEECVDLRYVTECESIEEWVTAISRIIKDNEDLDIDDKIDELRERIGKLVDTKRCEGEMIWSDSLGTVIMI
jgi:hypothetical protein